MIKLEDLKTGDIVLGIVSNEPCEILLARLLDDNNTAEITYKGQSTGLAQGYLFRSDEDSLNYIEPVQRWPFNADGQLFRLVSEAQRIRMAHLFDPHFAVHTSNIDPLPHQITAVYDKMLKIQPLRFLLADDPGAGKTIMAGLLLKELIARGDVERCLIVCPSSLEGQWFDELRDRFQLHFDVMSNDKLATARSGNWFADTPFGIARLDKLARDESLHKLLQDDKSAYDLVICDEAHKMSASYSVGDTSYTKRYRLGQLLSKQTRHFLLLTATPHNGKDADFQLFMRLLDQDRFEGRFRSDERSTDVSDLMRRMVKEDLFKFDGTRLFPDRHVESLPYTLSEGETELYEQVTAYVREEFNRADALTNAGRANNIGFALTSLQRRLASSPEAIYQSLRNRKDRLTDRLEGLLDEPDLLDDEEIENLDDAADDDIRSAYRALDGVTAAQTSEELENEIASVSRLETLALRVRNSGDDRKWQEVLGVLQILRDKPEEKLVIFTEHRDTLNYLHRKITDEVEPSSVAMIHGGVAIPDRRRIQEDFQQDDHVRILLANDAASEGINLHRATLMINYDLPWNPNRIEQRFGRIHRIGQEKPCYLWNLIAADTREGDVYLTLLAKLNEARNALGGKVFDVLGSLLNKRELSDLMKGAIRKGEDPKTRDSHTQQINEAFDIERIQKLFQDSLALEPMTPENIHDVREDLERAEAKRLQPHYIRSFFIEAFKRYGGGIRPIRNEPGLYRITKVPDAMLDHSSGSDQLLAERYENVNFEKRPLLSLNTGGVEFIRPGHPLLDTTINLVLDKFGKYLKRGAVLVDESDAGAQPRLLFYLKLSVSNESVTRGKHTPISEKMVYVELDASGNPVKLEYAPYLDYRPLGDEEARAEEILSQPECSSWIGGDLESIATKYAIVNLVQPHLNEVKMRVHERLNKEKSAVNERLSNEIARLKRSAENRKNDDRLNSEQAFRNANELERRLARRNKDIEDQRNNVRAQPVEVLGYVLVVPMGLLSKISGASAQSTVALKTIRDTQAIAARAREAVMDVERRLGYEPVDREFDRLGYDIESRAADGKLRFIEVKGRAEGATTITVTKNEVLTCLNKPDDYILAIVEFKKDGTDPAVYYVRNPFKREPDFHANSVNYDIAELLKSAEAPR